MRSKTPPCRAGAPSPLAERAGYVPRCVERENWCTRRCAAACGAETANEDALCGGCEGDWIRGIGDDDIDTLIERATVPHGLCRSRGAA